MVKIHKLNLINLLLKRIYPSKIVEDVNLSNNQSGSMLEDIELGSGCVATMGATTQPTMAQKELNMNDILNSKMINKAIELFQPETQIRVKSKL